MLRLHTLFESAAIDNGHIQLAGWRTWDGSLASHLPPGQTQQLTANDHAVLQSLRGLTAIEDCAELIDTLLSSNRKLEQEALSIQQIVEQLRET